MEENSLTVEKAIAQLQQTVDLGQRYYAAWWLGRFRVKETIAVKALIEALADEEDRAPDGGYPLRRNAARALGKLGDTQAVEPLIGCLAISDYYLREAAAQSLEMLGDPRAIPPLRELLTGGVAAAQMVQDKPHLIQPYEAIIEALGTLKATDAINDIEPFLEHFIPKVKYATARAMYQLTGNPRYGEILVAALTTNELQLRRSALIDLGASGYLAGAEAIASTLAENSIKLLSLKALLEHQLNHDPHLSPQSIKIMNLMDGLL